MTGQQSDPSLPHQSLFVLRVPLDVCLAPLTLYPFPPIAEEFSLGKAPTMQDSQAISDELFANFVAEECDKVEMIFTKFVSLITSEPSIQTLLPLTPSGELCNADGTCVDAANDEIFKLTSKGGKFEVSRESKPIETEALDPGLIFEQEPTQILDSLLPLYLNAAILRSLQESLASELAARMNAMANASDNAKELRKVGGMQSLAGFRGGKAGGRK